MTGFGVHGVGIGDKGIGHRRRGVYSEGGVKGSFAWFGKEEDTETRGVVIVAAEVWTGASVGWFSWELEVRVGSLGDEGVGAEGGCGIR